MLLKNKIERKVFMIIRFFLILITFFFVGAVSASPLPMAEGPEIAGFSMDGLSNLDRFFAEEISANRVPGAVIGIARDGKLVHYKAYGYLDKAKGTPMPLDAVFGYASMTKIMTSVGALMLTQEGRLPLKSRLDSYFPEFAEMKVGVVDANGEVSLVAQKRPIFIQDLFRHTSGLMYGGRIDAASPVARMYPGAYGPAFEGSTDDFISMITKLPLAHQPGTVFEYGFSVAVLGAVIEKLSGKRLGEYLAERVWGPLKMVDSTFQMSPEERLLRVAQPLPNNPLTGKPQDLPALRKQTAFDSGGEAALGTVPDFLRFGQMLMNGGELDGARPLSPQMVAHMTANHLGPEIHNRVGIIEAHREGYGFGLGVAVRINPGIAAV